MFWGWLDQNHMHRDGCLRNGGNTMRWMSFPSRSRHVPWLVILSCCLAVPLALVGCGQGHGVLGAATHAATSLPTKAPWQMGQAQATVDASCPAPTPQPGIF